MPLPAALMRAGTSKGLFIHRHQLPASESQWAGPLLAAMGSQNSDARQIDGIGGATSTTSKVAVVSPSSRSDIDVDYTFVQVAVGQQAVDFSGNCGNMCAGVGLFAVQEGLARPASGERSVDVRIFNTNTSRVIVDTVQVDDDGFPLEDGDYVIPGVKGTGSEIKVAFVDPAGSMTGKLFPTSRRNETITVKERNGTTFSVKASLIDAANPFVLVDASTLPAYLQTAKRDSSGYLEHMESIRRVGAVAMGLASSTEAAAKVRGTPKLALLSPAPAESARTEDDGLSIQVLAFSMGKPHPSLQLTGAACLAAAVCIEGTVAHSISSPSHSTSKDRALADALSRRLTTSEHLPTPPSSSGQPTREGSPASDGSEDGTSVASTPPSELQASERKVRIFHASGGIDVGVVAASSDDWAVVDRCSVSRTARRIFDGVVYYYQ
ncbi:hypothetical protein SLS61_003694 [Didymella pomorum]